MISGYNTDVEHGGVTYHVQTEDKGAPSFLITSLVYDRGTILASKRTVYTDDLGTSPEEKEIAEKLSRQHKLICAAVKTGRLGDLQKLSERPHRAVAPAANEPVAIPVGDPLLETAPVLAVPPAEQPLNLGETAGGLPPTAYEYDPQGVISVDPEAITAEQLTIEPAAPSADDEQIFDEVSIIELDEADILPADAIEFVEELPQAPAAGNEKLILELLGDYQFKGSDRKTVSILVLRGSGHRVVPGAQIMIKILGSSFRPVIFHATSDRNGLASVHLQIPSFNAGRAAILLRVISDGEEVELRRIVTPG